ncbi:17711_t:CDS:2, partial [Gigaspora rosea]
DITGINVSTIHGHMETRGLFFNNEEDIDSYPTLAVAAIYKLQNVPLGAVLFGIRSIISKYDTSGITATSIASLPKPDHPEDFSLGLSKLSNNTGKGAYDDVTYYVRPLTRGGGAPNVTSDLDNEFLIDTESYINREKILPVQFNKEDRNIKGCNKRLSNKIEVRKKELTEGHKTFEAACNAWVMKVDSFKIQIKASEDKNQKDSINKEDLNKACRLWISRVKNIIVITKKEQKKHVDTLPSNMMDRIPSKNMNLKLYYERY